MEENTMKLQANDLRIGNLIYWDIPEKLNRPHEVVGIFQDRVQTVPISLGDSMKDYLPIPLTPEWLERFGFEFHHDGAYNETIYIKGLPKPPFLWGVYPTELGAGVVVKNSAGLSYVHQLQNLYFALTGQELTLKP